MPDDMPAAFRCTSWHPEPAADLPCSRRREHEGPHQHVDTDAGVITEWVDQPERVLTAEEWGTGGQWLPVTSDQPPPAPIEDHDPGLNPLQRAILTWSLTWALVLILAAVVHGAWDIARLIP